MLKAIFSEASGGDAILAAWLVDVEPRRRDRGQGRRRRARRGSCESRLGLELPDGVGIAKARAAVLRYVLGGEFRSDLGAPHRRASTRCPRPRPRMQRRPCGRWPPARASNPALYPAIADQVELELGLATRTVPAAALGSIDTFRFEERVVFEHTADLIADGAYDEALRHRRRARPAASGWPRTWFARRSGRRAAAWPSWAASRRAVLRGARLGWRQLSRLGAALHRRRTAGIELDQAQRRMETLGRQAGRRAARAGRRRGAPRLRRRVPGDGRRVHQGLAKGGWAVPGALHQTQVFGQVVAQQPKPVAYFLVDAMRYEMGAELVERLPAGAEVRIRPAIAALPSITPVGMAALQPDAEGSFDVVVAENGKFGSRIEDDVPPGPHRAAEVRRRLGFPRSPT